MSKKGKEKRLDELFRKIRELNPNNLHDLNSLIRLYSMAQMVIGHLDADALYNYGQAYSERKRTYAEVIESETGTVAEKESRAEIETYDLRLKEWEAKSESRKWQNMFNSIDNLIIALRRDERTAMEEYQKVNDLYER